MSKSYIYKITNKETGSIYIGQTTQKSVEVRFKQHINDSKRTNTHLSKAINKYGKDSFKIEVIHTLEEHDVLELNRLEVWYIKKYNATSRDNYNHQTGGTNGSNVRGKYGIELAEKISKEIEKGIKTFSEISIEFGVPPSYVSDINCGEVFPQISQNYPISDRSSRREFSTYEIDTIYSRLSKGESSQSIAVDFNISTTSIANINNGSSYRREGVSYPVFKPTNSRKRYTTSEVHEIVEFLKQGMTYYAIQRDFGYARKTVSNINNGISYKKDLELLGICDFPIKK